MFRYAFYRMYSYLQRHPDDPDPLFGAMCLWGVYIEVVLIPIIAHVEHAELPWVPPFVAWHPVKLSALLAAVLLLIAHFAWVKNGVYATLASSYRAEPTWRKSVRSIIFWLWPGVGAALIVALYDF